MKNATLRLIINELIKKYPNDAELGAAVRKLFTSKK